MSPPAPPDPTQTPSTPSTPSASSASSAPSDPPSPDPTIAIVGLGRMGGNMARRLRRAGIVVHGYDRGTPRAEVVDAGVRLHDSLADLVAALPAGRPRLVWLMLPQGAPTDSTIAELAPRLTAGDIVVDGGNAHYVDSVRRHETLAAQGLRFVDCGVSGGIWGYDNGYCLMFGGPADAIDALTPIARALAPTPDTGWVHCGAVGAGHFAKMIHNGIEYGMMQALAEGFALMDGHPEYAFDLGAIAESWRHGSVVRSWLLDLSADALRSRDSLDRIAPVVADSGEGRWTVDEAIRQGTPAPVIALSVMSRFASQGRSAFADRLLAAMRGGFGGHPVPHED
ncbi:MAG: decarboxylating 6-phosphogluconate dehydrogenase [Burkholderiaceae bacterium]